MINLYRQEILSAVGRFYGEKVLLVKTHSQVSCSRTSVHSSVCLFKSDAAKCWLLSKPLDLLPSLGFDRTRNYFFFRLNCLTLSVV